MDSLFNKILDSDSDSSPRQQDSDSDSDSDSTLQKFCGLGLGLESNMKRLGLGLESTKAGLYPSLIEIQINFNFRGLDEAILGNKFTR